MTASGVGGRPARAVGVLLAGACRSTAAPMAAAALGGVGTKRGVGTEPIGGVGT